MSDQPVCVLDTSVCIDLFVGGVAEVSLALPIQWILPDLIIEEMQTPPELAAVFAGVVHRAEA